MKSTSDSVASDEVRNQVRDRYRKAVKAGPGQGCGCEPQSCCGPSEAPTSEQFAHAIGYSTEDIASLPEGANMGLGCGNPQAIAALKPGETVVDLGSGGGIDCFLAAKQVGETGTVIGVDMTPEMITSSRRSAADSGFSNVEFRLGEIEHLPLADGTVDVIMSNCVINLSPDKQAVYNEAFRVLKPGGRLAVSDIVALKPMPEELKQDVEALTGCIAGAETENSVRSMLEQAGFSDIRFEYREELKAAVRAWKPELNLDELIASASITAVKPAAAARRC